MRRILVLGILSSLWAGSPCWAQTSQPAADDSKPAVSNAPGQQYPRIDSQLRATFRVNAPNARKVQISVGKNYDMVKVDNGVWTVTTDPLVPGFHYYWLVIDGVRVADPASESFFGVSQMCSGIEVPENGVDFYDARDVPHGEIRERWYFSRTTAASRRIFVYTPPDYDSNRDARYPVLYLQHGGGEDERGWVVQGHVNHIMDNLIAEKKVKPMIVVMGKGYARKPGEPQVPLRPPAAGAGMQPPDFRRMFGALEEVFIQDLIPFAWVGAFSPAPNTKPAAQLVPDPAAAKQKLILLWLSCGNKDGLIGISQVVHAYLKEKEVPHIWHVDSNAHDSLEWRSNLYLFSQRIFR